MRICKYTSVLLSVVILISCGRQSKEQPSTKQLTLIFCGYPKNNSATSLGNGLYVNASADIYYLNDSLLERNYLFRGSSTNDTLRIKSLSDWVEITHYYRIVEKSSYLFHNGDTAVFQYHNDYPTVSVINRATRVYDLNFDLQKRKLIMGDATPALYRYLYPYMYDSNRDRFHLISSFGKRDSTLIDTIRNEYLKEFLALDSLKGVGLMSELIYQYRRNTLVSKVYGMYSTGFKIGFLLTKMLADTASIEQNDSLLPYGYYRNMLSYRLLRYIKQINPVKRDQGVSPNYCAEFDTISHLRVLSLNEKKFFLLTKIAGIADEEGYDVLERYVKLYSDLTQDSSTVRQLLHDKGIALDQCSDLLLSDIEGVQFNFDSVLNRNRGNVIYVDFWASWCAPCRASMPFAAKLRKEYGGRKVVFVYLAFNDNESQWLKAMASLTKSGNASYYLVRNSKTAKMVRDLRIQTIPRYLIYNRLGKLVEPKAPGPEGGAIRVKLDRLLKE